MTDLIWPLPDETAGSLLFRLATQNCQTVADFGETQFDLSHQQARSDLDRIIPRIRLDAMQSIVNSSQSLAERISIPNRWTCSVWNNVTRQYNGPIRICCACLKQCLYGRRYWRSCFAVACPDHGVELIERCPHCRTPIPYFSADSGMIRQHWLESWPYCHVCFHQLSSSNPAHRVLIDMSRRWRSALAGRPQLGFSAEAFLKLSARSIQNFRELVPYQHTSRLIASGSCWPEHVAAALMIRSLGRRRVPVNVCYAAFGMPICPDQLAIELMK